MAPRIWCSAPTLVALSTAVSIHPAPERPPDDPLRSPTLSYMRRERAARALTIANAVEPQETATALRLARSALRHESMRAINSQERSFLHNTLREGLARGLACAAGGAAAAYAILKIVLLIIPLVPSPYVTRAAMSAVSFGAAVAELAAFPDITTIELLLMKNESYLGARARSTIEQYNPHLLLLQTLDRQSEISAYQNSHKPSTSTIHPSQQPYFDTDIQCS